MPNLVNFYRNNNRSPNVGVKVDFYNFYIYDFLSPFRHKTDHVVSVDEELTDKV